MTRTEASSTHPPADATARDRRRVSDRRPAPSRCIGRSPGPIGLGFPSPCLVVSPFSRGGTALTRLTHHTSTLALLAETRFGVEVPNLSAWRRSVTGDLRPRAFRARPHCITTVPTLPATSLGDTQVAEQAVINALAGTGDEGVPYPLPTTNSMPHQEKTPRRRKVRG